MDKLWRNRDWLWEHYVVRKEPAPAMAKEAECSGAAIYYWLYKWNISICDRNDLWRNRDWLWKHYVGREESMLTVAQGAGCSEATIYKWLYKMDIPVRSRSEAIFLAERNSVIITPDLLKFMGGEIIGDGHMGMRSDYSAFYAHSSKYEEYLIWLSEHFAEWGIKQSGRITKYKNRQNDAISYHYASKSYPELIPTYKRWYPDGRKIIPKDLRLTRIMTRQWYLGDSYLAHPKHRRSHIKLFPFAFSKEEVEYLVVELNRLGFKATRQPSTNAIRIWVQSVPAFLSWIGPCPISCYDYKWEYEKRT